MKKKHAFHWHINFYLVLFFLVTMLGVSLLAHHRYAERQRKWYGDLPEIQKRGVLRALTLYSSASYFIYRDKEMGYEYELCAQLARSLGLKLKIITAPNLLALKDSLDAGVGDIVAYNVPVTLSNRDKYLYCGRDFLTHYVVVQREDNPQLVTEVTQLVGKEVYVEKGTNMELRLQHLNEELGGGIIIKPVEEDSITTEELIGRVARGQLDYVIADNVTAQWNKTYYRSLHVSTQIGFPQKNAWLVRYDSPKLAAAVNEWFKKNLPSENYQAIQKKYFELSKGHTPFVAGGRLIGKDGHI
jgi:membrane-bound lytic murein transglycosylase F